MGVKGKIKKAWKAAEDLGLLEEVEDFLRVWIKSKQAEQRADREEYKEKLDEMSPAELEATFIPKVYQKDIYSIDYGRLKEKGIDLISFDIDDTIADSIINKVADRMPFVKVPMPDEAKELFRKLKEMGFTVTLLTNAGEKLAGEVCKTLGADDYIAKAEKPETKSFEEMMRRYGKDSSQMAHVGNNICEDVAGGNRAHVTTCLVRRAGCCLKAVKVIGIAADIPTKGDLVRQKLEGKWRKHHKFHYGDQYYQLGGQPEYRKGETTVPVTVIYDGKSPLTTTENVKACLQRLGYGVIMMSAKEYGEKLKAGDSVKFGKVIIIGHHELARKRLEKVGMMYNYCGMMFGFQEDECVLRASRSALGRGKRGREKFRDYYNSRLPGYAESAAAYKIPSQFGKRSETRKSQYDLLWLEFERHGMGSFLNETLEDGWGNKEPDFIQQAVNDLAGKFEEDKDAAYNIEDLMRDSYKQIENSGMATLRKHLGKDIVCTGTGDKIQDARELREGELLDGELSAFVFTVGCYTVRQAWALYRDDASVHYSERVPAGRDEIAAYRTDGLAEGENYREVCEISARHNGNSDHWQHICLAAMARNWQWSERVDFICTVKRDITSPDNEAVLFVLKEYTGNSFSVEHWYKCIPDGTVTEYELHPFNEEAFKEHWTV